MWLSYRQITIKGRLDAILILLTEFIGLARPDSITAYENNRIGHRFRYLLF